MWRANSSWLPATVNPCCPSAYWQPPVRVQRAQHGRVVHVPELELEVVASHEEAVARGVKGHDAQRALAEAEVRAAHGALRLIPLDQGGLPVLAGTAGEEAGGGRGKEGGEEWKRVDRAAKPRPVQTVQGRKH